MDLKKFEEAAKKYKLSPFKLSVFIQKRVRELVHGAPPLVNSDGPDHIDVAMDEFIQGKTALEEGGEEEESEDSPIQALPQRTGSISLAALTH